MLRLELRIGSVQNVDPLAFHLLIVRRDQNELWLHILYDGLEDFLVYLVLGQTLDGKSFHFVHLCPHQGSDVLHGVIGVHPKKSPVLHVVGLQSRGEGLGMSEEVCLLPVDLLLFESEQGFELGKGKSLFLDEHYY